jgi:carbonic anhydrase
MIPAYEEVAAGKTDSSVLATLEYALNVLEIENIIVCGHSECGAMAALLKGESAVAGQQGLKAWLHHGKRSFLRFQRADVLDEHISPANHLAQINVIQQLDNLRAYPLIQQKVTEGKLQLWGWYFDIEEVQLMTYSPEVQRFVKIDAQVAETFRRAENSDLQPISLPVTL